MAVSGPTSDHDEIRQWAERNGAVPVVLLPHLLDTEPAVLRFMLAAQVEKKIDLRVLGWEEFFLKFDSLGLSFAYDEEDAGYNEILQVEERSAYRHPEYRPEGYVH